MNAPDDSVPWQLGSAAADPAHRAEPDRGRVGPAVSESDAFAELFRAHASAIGSYLLRRCGDSHLTDDLVSETFLAAYRAFSRFEERGVPVRVWLYRIATRALHAHWRRTWWRTLVGLDDIVEPAASAAQEPDVEGAAAARIALAALPRRYQDVATLFYLEELGVPEIAAVLRLREGTVKSRLHRARHRLATALGARR
jgi:RNA polymerase sigma factor (sigma-70 family)